MKINEETKITGSDEFQIYNIKDFINMYIDIEHENIGDDIGCGCHFDAEREESLKRMKNDVDNGYIDDSQLNNALKELNCYIIK